MKSLQRKTTISIIISQVSVEAILDGSGANSSLLKGANFSGEIAFTGTMHLDGTFSGLIASDDGTLMVGISGEIDASIEVAIAQIHGTFKGDISAKERVVLKSTAIVMGDIETPSLCIE